MTDVTYDNSNVFARILRGEIPAKKMYEDDFALAFPDMHPQAPVHLLVIPKGAYTSYADFVANAPEPLISGFFRAVRTVAHQAGVGSAFRLITNNGERAGQSVHHFHVHILAGKPLGALLPE